MASSAASPASAITLALDELRAASSALISTPTMPGPAGDLHHLLMSAFHRLSSASLSAEAAGISLEERRAAVIDARTFCARFSPTLAHAQVWPRGYPGDFEIIERMLNNPDEETTGDFGCAVEDAVLRLPVVVQHHSKVAWQADLVRRCLGKVASPRVLSIGSGGSRDLMRLEPSELVRLAVVLNDTDADALSLSRDRLGSRLRSLLCVQGNALRRLAQLAAAGPYDLIVIGGLLDYVPERAARLLLRRARAMLLPGGLLGCTNIAARNPWRPFMELVTSWPLIERSAEEMVHLFDGIAPAPSVIMDASRLTWMVTVTADEEKNRPERAEIF